MRGTVLREPLFAYPTEVAGLQRARLTAFHEHRGRSQGDENAKDREHMWTPSQASVCVRETGHVRPSTS
jgi:hypothetical protein